MNKLLPNAQLDVRKTSIAIETYRRCDGFFFRVDVFQIYTQADIRWLVWTQEFSCQVHADMLYCIHLIVAQVVKVIGRYHCKRSVGLLDRPN